MIKKYELVDESGRKRLRALRNFSVQGRDVNVHDLGGYVYDDKTLSQEGNCWIFSGSLEYPGVRVMDEAIVDMGIDTAKVAPRMRACTIRGNSRIMGAVSFETSSRDVAQTPAMFEQGGYTATVGMIPVKASDGSRIRIAASVFGGSVGKVAVTSTSYEARIISIDSDGLVTSAGAWTAGGPAVTLTTTSPNFLVEVRKTPSGAITPADITTAGVTVTTASGASLEITNSSIITLYNGVPTNVANILRLTVYSGNSEMFNSCNRTGCAANLANNVYFNAKFSKVNYTLAIPGGASHHISGVFRNSNVESQKIVRDFGGAGGRKFFDVSDCPNFAYDPETFPDMGSMYSSGKTFYFKSCNMPVGSAIHYYDPKVNVWDNIDFTKAMADLGKKAFADTTIVSSNVQGMYRARGNTNGSIGGLLEAASSFDNATYVGTAGATYDCITYKDCVVKGKFTLSGRCVFGGTQGGAVRITNTKAEAMVVDGSFRIDGNAQVTDTPLKGTGYIGGNAELKNGNVDGYIYMDGNAKFIPAAVTNPYIIRMLNMTGDSKVLKQADSSNHSVRIHMSDNAVLDAAIFGDRGTLVMRENATITRGSGTAATFYGVLTLEGKASIKESSLVTYGDITLTDGFAQTSGAPTIRGKRTIANVSEIAAVELPPTKITW